MKNLIIITTYSKYLPVNEQGKGLFTKDSCEEAPIPAPELQKVFGENRDIWKLKDEKHYVFGSSCLNKNEEGDQLEDQQKQDYIRGLLTDVIDSIDLKKRAEIGQIFLFAHGGDLDWPKKVMLGPYDEYPLLKAGKVEWLGQLFPEKKIVVGQPGRIAGAKEVGVYVTAFSHVPHPLLNLIESRKGIEDEEVGIKLANIAQGMRGWTMEKQWADNVDLPEMPAEKLPFSFRFLYPDPNGLTDEAPEDFPYAELRRKYLEERQDPESARKVNVVFLPLTEIAAYNNEEQEFYKKVIGYIYGIDKAKTPCYPTIFISYKDIMSGEYQQENEVIELDARYKFLDSSIWYRYVAIEPVGNQDFSKNLQLVFNTITWAFETELYKKNVCFEFLEFQNRLVLNSYLDNSFGSGHARRVFPFTFHSETAMERRAARIASEFRDKALKWNFLFADDFANSRLREGKYPGAGPEKCDIIIDLIEATPGSMSPPNQECIIGDFKSAETIGATWMLLQKTREDDSKKEHPIIYDIILLDYLFSRNLEYPHYGIELLDKIEQAKVRRGLGVLQSYWIYPVSVFNEAIQSHLQEKGYQYLEQYWHLARGADALNTPHLFRRTLYEFMQAQVGKILFREEDLWQFIANNPLSGDKTLDPKQNGNSNTDKKKLNRELAIQAFRRFIERFSVDEGLPAGSALSESALKQLEGTSVKALRDHIRQLLYLLGFSVGFDFPIIEREFRVIEDAFEKFRNKKENDPNLIASIDKSMNELSLAIYSISGKYF
ncbi:MAG: hypothetical protein H6565_04320 [Lewinellaceae bacterium]|nr:hypothetical protein [Lewinellaceae bacterium]